MTPRVIEEYLSLLPSRSRSQPDFVAFVTAMLEPFVEIQNCMLGMPDDFDLDNAVGVQLDEVGQRVGVSRKLPVPITGVYFEFDSATVGLDQGVWMGPFDPVSGLTNLDDETYRLVIRVKILANTWDGTLEDAQTILATLQGAGTYIFVQDNFDMTMTVGVGGVLPSVLFTAILRQIVGYVKPKTVGIDLIVATSTDGAPIFGFDIGNGYMSGLDVGAWAVEY